jgi:hypothetical protein
MAIFSISDIAISGTLFVNALALMSPKLRGRPISSESGVHTSISEVAAVQEDNSIRSRLLNLVNFMRRSSGVIALWNIILLICMIFVFN